MNDNKLDQMQAHPNREKARRPQSMIAFSSNELRQKSGDKSFPEALGLYPGQFGGSSATISHQGFQFLLQEMETCDSRINKRKSGFFGSSAFNLSSKNRIAEEAKGGDPDRIDSGMTTKKKRKLDFPFHSRRGSKSSTDVCRTKENEDKLTNRKRNCLQISIEAMDKAKQMPRTKGDLADQQHHHWYPSSNTRQLQPNPSEESCEKISEPKFSAYSKSDLTKNITTNHFHCAHKTKATSVCPNEKEMLKPISETTHELFSRRRKNPKSPGKSGWRLSARFSLVESNTTIHKMERPTFHRRLSSRNEHLSSSSNSEENDSDVKLKSEHAKLPSKSSIRSLLKSWVQSKSQEKQKTTNAGARSDEPVIHFGLSLRETLNCEAEVEKKSEAMLTLLEKKLILPFFPTKCYRGEIRKRFADFLKKEFSNENLEFWIEVEKYKHLKNLKSSARNIFNNFVASHAPREINIEARVRKEIASKIEDPHSFIFDEAQQHIFKLMENDSFRRFLNCHSKNKS